MTEHNSTCDCFNRHKRAVQHKACIIIAMPTRAFAISLWHKVVKECRVLLLGHTISDMHGHLADTLGIFLCPEWKNLVITHCTTNRAGIKSKHYSISANYMYAAPIHGNGLMSSLSCLNSKATAWPVQESYRHAQHPTCTGLGSRFPDAPNCSPILITTLPPKE